MRGAIPPHVADNPRRLLERVRRPEHGRARSGAAGDVLRALRSGASRPWSGARRRSRYPTPPIAHQLRRPTTSDQGQHPAPAASRRLAADRGPRDHAGSGLARARPPDVFLSVQRGPAIRPRSTTASPRPRELCAICSRCSGSASAIISSACARRADLESCRSATTPPPPVLADHRQGRESRRSTTASSSNPESLPSGVSLPRDLFRLTARGIAVDGRPIFSFQYHPEASPGPHAASYLFSAFRDHLRRARDQPRQPPSSAP